MAELSTSETGHLSWSLLSLLPFRPPSLPLIRALQCNFLIAVYQGGGMQRVSMPSDLTATSPLLLQLLNPLGFTLQSRPAQTQSQTQAPWLQRDLLLACLSPRSRPLDQPCSHTPVPGSRNNLPPPPPPTLFFLITTNSHVKSQTVALLRQLCVLGPVTV